MCLILQEVASELGAPAKIFYKCDDKMRIHSPDADRNSSGLKSDYIYNYFSLGIVSTVCYDVGLI